MDAHYYQVNLNWIENRTGELSSPELNDSLAVATPPPFPKGTEGIWSPEHLLTAAVSSCFMTTFLAIAENFKLEFQEFDCKAKGKLELVDGKFLMTEVLLEASLSIINSEDAEKAEKVLQKSEAACLISNSIKSKVSLETKISVLNG